MKSIIGTIVGCFVIALAITALNVLFFREVDFRDRLWLLFFVGLLVKIILDFSERRK